MSFCLGQVLPTVPANIFRVTVQNYNSSQELSLRNQKFSMHGISHAYFNNSKKNTFGIYNSSSDLFHVGSYELAESVTTESFLKVCQILMPGILIHPEQFYQMVFFRRIESKMKLVV